LDFVRKCLEEKGLAGAYRADTVLGCISYAKNQLWDAEDIARTAGVVAFGTFDSDFVAEIFALYERRLRLNHAIDFDDCIYKAVRILQSNEDIRLKLQSDYPFILVDEFQDTNMTQLRILELLAGTNKNVCVVGDDDQSIYGWRGARADILVKFEEAFPGAELIKLQQNYRCTSLILNSANELIKNNSGRKDKKLWSKKETPAKITLFRAPNPTEEAIWIARRCLALQGKGYKPKDICILYRANNQNKTLELAFREHHLQYKVYGGQSLFERKEIKDVLAYLRLVANLNERPSFWRIINTPPRGFGLKTLETIEELSQSRRLSPFKVLCECEEDLPARVRGDGRRFADEIMELKNLRLEAPEDLSALVHRIIKTFHLETEIRAQKLSEDSMEAKINSLRRVPVWLSEMAKRVSEDIGRFDLMEIMDRVTLNDTDKREADGDKNHISLMTIHAAKGLEFAHVFVCGLNDGILPHNNSLGTPHGLEEERRLLYVAITRAKEKLHLSYTDEQGAGVRLSSAKRSRFLEELPKDLLSTEDGDDSGLAAGMATPGERKQRVLGRLAELRGQLK